MSAAPRPLLRLGLLSSAVLLVALLSPVSGPRAHAQGRPPAAPGGCQVNGEPAVPVIDGAGAQVLRFIYAAPSGQASDTTTYEHFQQLMRLRRLPFLGPLPSCAEPAASALVCISHYPTTGCGWLLAGTQARQHLVVTIHNRCLAD